MQKVELSLEHEVSFHNNVDYCVGTGRMGLALHKEYWEQLAFVQKTIGFSYIRGHGLFCDDMAIYHEYEAEDGQKKQEYNFTYLDRVVDSYLELNIRPFLELGFMPGKLASGTQTQFYWKGNVTPPQDYKKWCALVQETIRHLMCRYGEEEVLTWPVEVWNEPNLSGFWENADMEEYFKLYELTAYAIKEVHPGLQVGGPAICGGCDEKWMKGFLTHCFEKELPLDFISRHHYTTELPEPAGHYGYVELYTSEYAFSTLRDCRKIIESYDKYKDLPFYITEFNSSYIPNAPVHDTNENAAYLARMLSEIGDYCTGYSYWTFGDVFEEQGVPFTPFHGGFGLVANGGIPKPTFWTFYFYKQLQGICLHRDEHMVVVRKKDGTVCGIAWNLTRESGCEECECRLQLPVEKEQYCIVTKTVDETVCNPLKVWHDLGEPANPDREQTELLQEAARPLVQTERLAAVSGRLDAGLSVKKNGVVYFEIQEAGIKSDRGYEYGRI